MKISSSEVKRYIISIAVFVVGFIFSIVIFVITRSWEVKRLKTEFGLHADDRVGAIVNNINVDLEILYSLNRFLTTNFDTTRKEFRKFTEQTLLRHPEILALEYIPRVTDLERSIFEEKVRKEGFSDFNIKEYDARKDRISIAPQRTEYFPLYYVEPFKRNSLALGHDYLSDQIRHTAMEKACDTNMPTATSGIELFREPTKDFGYLIFMPIYNTEKPQDTVEERRSSIKGFSSIVFLVGRLAEMSLKNFKTIGIDIYLYDETASNDKRLLYVIASPSMDGIKTSLISTPSKKSSIEVRRTIDISGRKWIAICRPTQAFLDRYNNWQSSAVFIIGMLLTILLSLYLFNIIGRATRIESLIVERTAQLNMMRDELKYEISNHGHTEELLLTQRIYIENLLSNINDAVITTDDKGLIVTINNIAENLTGWNNKDAIGKSLGEVFYSIDKVTRHRYDNPMLSVVVKKSLVRLADKAVVIGKDGAEKEITGSCIPIFDDKENVKGVAIIFRDIAKG
jgi:PAS domain S-box-containing protein